LVKSHFPFQISLRMFPRCYPLRISISASKYKYAKNFHPICMRKYIFRFAQGSNPRPYARKNFLLQFWKKLYFWNQNSLLIQKITLFKVSPAKKWCAHYRVKGPVHFWESWCHVIKHKIWSIFCFYGTTWKSNGKKL
jgi:hypothetical protein